MKVSFPTVWRRLSSNSAFLCIQLPNRLGKMLAPLHWQSYRKQYGRLDEFVSSHKEVILNSLCNRSNVLNQNKFHEPLHQNACLYQDP